MRFLGNIEARIDSKGRVFVPSVFRKILFANNQDVLYLRKDVFQNCIIIYPESVWEKELSFLRSKLSKWVEEEQDLYRQFMIEAEAVCLDKSGRVLISKKMLSLIGAESEIKFLGVDDTIEVWPKSALEKPRISQEDFKKRISELMSDKIKE